MNGKPDKTVWATPSSKVKKVLDENQGFVWTQFPNQENVKIAWYQQELLQKPLSKATIKNDDQPRASYTKQGLIYVQNYCNETSLHGFKYLVEPQRSPLERLFWLGALCFVYTTVGFVIREQVMAFIQSPVLMSLDSKSTPIWDIPFPAITVCSENQIPPSVFNFSAAVTKDYGQLTETEQNYLDYSNIICQIRGSISNRDILRKEVVLTMFKVGVIRCNGTFNHIAWLNKLYPNPCQLVQGVLTSSGFCYSFNSLPIHQLYRERHYRTEQLKSYGILKDNFDSSKVVWTPDEGFNSKEGIDFEHSPRRMSGRGFANAASFLLDINGKDFDPYCSAGGRGFKVIFHNPAEMSSSSHATIYAEVDKLSTVKVIPEISIASPHLRAWSPEQRGCYFATERPLIYFKYYTQHNCDKECESNLTLTRCGCVAYHQPREAHMPVCGPAKTECFLDSMRYAVEENVCNCLATCTALDYSVKITSASRNWAHRHGLKQGAKANNTYNEASIARMTVHFSSRKVIAMKRMPLFSDTDFIANIGGVMSLFLGFSLLSLFEFLYFLTLRIITDLWNWNQRASKRSKK